MIGVRGFAAVGLLFSIACNGADQLPDLADVQSTDVDADAGAIVAEHDADIDADADVRPDGGDAELPDADINADAGMLDADADASIEHIGSKQITFIPEAERFGVVSATPLAAGVYFLSDYGTVFLFDRASGTARVMTPPPNIDRFNPAAVHYNAATRHLFIANYNGDDILEAELNLDAHTFEVIRRISSEDTDGPEGVAVSEDGTVLIAANNDGDTIEAFDLTRIDAPRIWYANVPIAHGLAIVGETVYSTSLQNRTLTEYNLRTGARGRRIGEIGWDPADANFLWPVTVAAHGSDELLVIDAHTGYVTVLDRHTLRVLDFFGGNGATFDFLHLPYGVAAYDDEFIVLSTFQQRAIFGRTDTWEFEESFAFRADDWTYEEAESLIVEPLGIGWDQYVYRQGPRTRLMNVEYVRGYSRLVATGTGPDIVLPTIRSALNPGSAHIYFTQVLTANEGMFLLAPNHSTMFYVDEQEGVCVPYSLSTFDNWVIDDRLYGPRGVVDHNAIEASIRAVIPLLELERGRNGLLSIHDLIAWLEIFADFSHLGEETFTDLVQSAFRLPEADSFFAAYLACDQACDGVAVHEAVDDYFAAASGVLSVDLDEICLIAMLSGATNLDLSP